MAVPAWLDRFRQYSSAPPASGTPAGAGLEALECGQLEEAVRQFLAALAQAPDQALPLHALGFLEARDGRFAAAVAYLQRAARLAPRNATLRADLGCALQFAGEADAALAEYQQALALDPAGGPYLLNLGTLQIDRALYPAAEATLSHARRLDPHNAEVQLALALALLAQGKYETGFALYEARFHAGPAESTAAAGKLFVGYRQLRIAPWRGEPLAGKSLLVSHEQGSGDTLMALRYLPALKAQGLATLIVHCRPEVLGLIQALPSVDHAVVDAAALPPQHRVHYYCPAMSLPGLCRTRIDSIPPPAPQLSIPERLREAWSQRTGTLPGLKVGLAWAGNPRLPADRERSLHLRQLAPLLGAPGRSWISLQKGPAAAQIAELGLPLHHWMDQCADWLDTAALVQQLDLVLSVDTAIVHLAGILGKPAWLLDRFAGDWRWRSEGDTSPWYPATRIFRQPAPGDWSSAIQRLAAELNSH